MGGIFLIGYGANGIIGWHIPNRVWSGGMGALGGICPNRVRVEEWPVLGHPIFLIGYGVEEWEYCLRVGHCHPTPVLLVSEWPLSPNSCSPCLRVGTVTQLLLSQGGPLSPNSCSLLSQGWPLSPNSCSPCLRVGHCHPTPVPLVSGWATVTQQQWVCKSLSCLRVGPLSPNSCSPCLRVGHCHPTPASLKGLKLIH